MFQVKWQFKKKLVSSCNDAAAAAGFDKKDPVAGWNRDYVVVALIVVMVVAVAYQVLWLTSRKKEFV